MISAAAIWAIWGNDMFPAEQDPTGGTIMSPHRVITVKLTCNKIPKTGQPKRCRGGSAWYVLPLIMPHTCNMYMLTVIPERPSTQPESHA